ncbi:MAG TPA: threonine--tRNA ligase [Vitreimonas sp.]|nr:threonine--tRNA ligase [Vitreimonas sp.]
MSKPKHDQEYLDNLRHSVAHLLAAAVMELWPDTKRTIGPNIENGFYFDFEFSKPVSEADFPAIEKKMREMLPNWKQFERFELSVADAKKEYPSNQYKHELIDKFAEEGKTITFYKSGEYWDLCKGGHVENPAEELKYFKLQSVAGAYWLGDEKNPMLTRIYGTAWPSQAELDEYLQRQAEAKARDHKKLGKELDLFVFSDTVGKGLPLWTPKGAAVRRELERFIVDEEIKRGYLHVYTPDIANLDLYKKSGHYPYYKDSMYAPIVIDEEEYMLRPMTCPHHFELYSSRPHSYKELPMRFAELAKLYRYEQSGELSGLQRVRSFCLADAHIVCRREQAKSEINGVLDLIEYISNIFKFTPGEQFWYRLSLGDRSDDKKYFKDDESWDFAENVLRSVLEERDAHFVEAPQEAAFYGPKIDVQMRNVNGKEDTAFTVQYDFVMPKRFDLKFVNEAGVEEQPIVVHRSSIGAIERVMAFLIEHYAGAFPLWMAPTQVRVLPIADRHHEYSQQVVHELSSEKMRVEFDDRAESLSAKIRDAKLEKIPYVLVIGDKEMESGSVAVNARGAEPKSKPEVMKLEEFVAKLNKEIKDKV